MANRKSTLAALVEATLFDLPPELPPGARPPPARHRSNFQDITGKRFGRLVAVRCVGRTRNSSPLWELRCDCGKTVVRQGSAVRAGTIRSCGCLMREVAAASQRTHGQSRTREYWCWRAMIARCYNPKDAGYENYGGRGITICDRWRASVLNFIEDMGRVPSPDHSIDRINVDGNYEPGNCRWAVTAVQVSNKRCNHRLTYNGVTRTLAEWSRATGFAHLTILARLRRGWSVERALTAPLHHATRRRTARAV